jgi:hypothetical protein
MNPAQSNDVPNPIAQQARPPISWSWLFLGAKVPTFPPARTKATGCGTTAPAYGFKSELSVSVKMRKNLECGLNGCKLSNGRRRLEAAQGLSSRQEAFANQAEFVAQSDSLKFQDNQRLRFSLSRSRFWIRVVRYSKALAPQDLQVWMKMSPTRAPWAVL